MGRKLVPIWELVLVPVQALQLVLVVQVQVLVLVLKAGLTVDGVGEAMVEILNMVGCCLTALLVEAWTAAEMGASSCCCCCWLLALPGPGCGAALQGTCWCCQLVALVSSESAALQLVPLLALAPLLVRVLWLVLLLVLALTLGTGCP